ncbi:tetratricopeptide repeat protein [Desulfobulbus alkaliphilus]|uniref:tetratricopeptide repeat protein n=1 Tax=Desulfobulbus alkaliphilus TaxID=869814 RepID=UPI0019647DD5|nr:tetratricopeptide repeat protein [Desulfobulbus alkaliphilus]MBM9536422.1 tetratricopeptide repeat protein [Desulfobulbus alkaliphilus]
MYWLAGCNVHRWAAFLGCLVFLLSSCGLQSTQPGLERQKQLSAVNGSDDNEVDFSCSYFYFLWGRHAELRYRFAEALEAYEKALICDSGAQFIYQKIPLLLLRLERTDEAAAWLDTYLENNPENSGMRMLYAKVLARQGHHGQARQQYRIISDRHPDDPTILLLLAEMYLAESQFDQARSVLDRVLVLDPNSYSGHVLLARLLRMENAIDQAIGHYQKALARNWSSDLQMEFGEMFLSAARYEEAAAVYREIIEREEENENARIALIHVYLLQNKDEQALVELNNLRSFVDQPQRVDLTIARLYARQSEFDKAIAVTESILEREELAEARYLLALLFVQTQRYHRALQEVRLIEQRADEYSEALLLQVRILREQNRLKEAIQVLEEHVALDTFRSAEMYSMLAVLHQLNDRDDLSRKVLLEGLAFFPEDENLLYEYGLWLEHSGDHNEAMQIMLRIIELKPDHAAALNFVGYSWADQKVHLDKALEYIQRAIELKPDNGYIRDSLGWVYFRLGRIDQATRELEAAVELVPDDPAILDHLGDVYLESGRIREALDMFKRAAELYEDDEKEKKRVLEKIEILEKQASP